MWSASVFTVALNSIVLLYLKMDVGTRGMAQKVNEWTRISPTSWTLPLSPGVTILNARCHGFGDALQSFLLTSNLTTHSQSFVGLASLDLFRPTCLMKRFLLVPTAVSSFCSSIATARLLTDVWCTFIHVLYFQFKKKKTILSKLTVASYFVLKS